MAVDAGRLADHLRIYSGRTVGGCLEWKGPVGANGPWFRMGGNSHNARHVAIEVWSGRALRPGVIPKVSCGNERCINPEHLMVEPSDYAPELKEEDEDGDIGGSGGGDGGTGSPARQPAGRCDGGRRGGAGDGAAGAEGGQGDGVVPQPDHAADPRSASFAGPLVWIAGRECGFFQHVGRDVRPSAALVVWVPLGVYDNAGDAAARCREWRDFYAPLPYGVDLPEELYRWEGVRYPLMPKSMAAPGE